MQKNDYGASHWSSDKVWERRRGKAEKLRCLGKIQSEILLEFLQNHLTNIRRSPNRVALERIMLQLEDAATKDPVD